MVKTFKFKLLIVSMVLLAIITSITAFSVSYAKWVANDNTTVSGSADVGVWDEEPENKNQYSNEIYINGGHTEIKWNDNYNGKLYGKKSFEITQANQEIEIIAYKDNVVIELTWRDNNNGVHKNGNRYTFERAGIYTVCFDIDGGFMEIVEGGDLGKK